MNITINWMKPCNKELFNKYILSELGFIRRLCRKYCLHKPDCPDLYNELLIHLFLYIHTYDTSKGIRSWLYVIVRRKMYCLQRKKVRAPVDFVDLEQAPYSCVPVWNGENRHGDVRVAVSMLGPVHRDIVRLRLDGYRIKEIAAMMYSRGHISAESRNIIKAKLREAYHALAGMLSRDGSLLRTPGRIQHTSNKSEQEIMAKLKSEMEKWVSMPDRDYLDLVEDHIMMTALRAAGIESLPIYKSAKSILKNNRVEIHLKPIKSRYK